MELNYIPKCFRDSLPVPNYWFNKCTASGWFSGRASWNAGISLYVSCNLARIGNSLCLDNNEESKLSYDEFGQCNLTYDQRFCKLQKTKVLILKFIKDIMSRDTSPPIPYI